MAKQWRELSKGQRTAIGALTGAQLALLGAALIDLQRRPAAEIKGSKRAWRAAVFVNFAGPLAYFAFGRKR
ncbi:PLDc N-terminal domain-containing protein [Nonomuraea sp. NPDC023979]|uniref:PLDc N-terminal domain-containing protein n=1 Tax=Nonomuraea sp. NPDC023979 TaxID=3154796 RepID=UPI0033FC7419